MNRIVMKPCQGNQKRIVALTLGLVDGEPAVELRAHLEHCGPCRRYFEEAHQLSDTLRADAAQPRLAASEAFHRKWIRTLAEQPRESAWQRLMAASRDLLSNWRLALLAGPAAAVALIAVLMLHHPATKTLVEVGSSASIGLQARDLAPTVANYESVAARSLQEFDDLVTQQSLRPLRSAHAYRASAALAARDLE